MLEVIGVVLVAGLLVLAGFTWLLRPVRSETRIGWHPVHGPDDSADDVERSLAVPRALRIPVQIVFSNAGHRFVALDCTLLERHNFAGRTLETGHPLSLCLVTPEGRELHDSVESTLFRWTTDGDRVEVQFLRIAGEPRVRLRTDTGAMQLDLERAVA